MASLPLQATLQGIGGSVLLVSWVVREIWGRRHEQSVLRLRKALDGMSRAEDGYLNCLTQRRILDSIEYMQRVIGFADEKPGGGLSPQSAQYLGWAREVQSELDKARTRYILDRLKNTWVAAKGKEPGTDQCSEWNTKDEEKLKGLVENLRPEVDIIGKALERKAHWANILVTITYVIGALLILVSAFWGPSQPV